MDAKVGVTKTSGCLAPAGLVVLREGDGRVDVVQVPHVHVPAPRI